ncbi:hypothetical protein D623_10015044 [Myotis brandtii]|uniref:Uncharacterized protein n=1 Tax=Myotis brandtii TaxID=109478 RepID=S7N9S4_MYOBR|nr:hypothetical protein D623_10015044 [Myotis brandtii]
MKQEMAVSHSQGSRETAGSQARKRVWEREVRLDKRGLNKWQHLQAAGAQEGGPGWGERSESKGPGRVAEGRATPDVEGPKEKPEEETGLNRPKRLEYRVGAPQNGQLAGETVRDDRPRTETPGRDAAGGLRAAAGCAAGAGRAHRAGVRGVGRAA